MAPESIYAEPRLAAREWLLCSAGVGTLVTAVDALLLHRKRGIFSGGFLAADHLDTMAERFWFLLVSFLSDTAVASILVVLAFVCARRLRLTKPSAIVLALTGSAAPFLLVDTLSYQLYRYLGDAFDLALMFDLTGRSVREIFAVSSAHLVLPFMASLLVLAAIAAVTFGVERVSTGRPVATRTPWKAAAALLLATAAVNVTARIQEPALDDALRRKASGQLFAWAAAGLSDVDRDGFGMLGRPPDFAPFDRRRYPYAVDWPGNNIDENGVAGDLPVGQRYVEGHSGGAWQQRPPVVLIVLESFRADAVGASLNGKAVTPILDRLATAGISSPRAFSHNGYTAQSRFHLFSGSLAGLRGRTGLVDDFKANGYEVGYFSGQDDSFGGAEFAVGMERADVSFDARSASDQRYSTFSTAGSLAVSADVVEEKIRAFLNTRSHEKPLFLYVNLHDTHFPYWHKGIEPLVSTVVLAPSEITPARAAELREMYLNTVANVDRAVGRILDRVQAHLGTAPGVIITADHGESLFDAGFLGHGYALNDAQTRIPLIVANLPLTIAEPFGQADLRDIIAAGLARPPGGASSPVIQQATGRSIFQYVGLIQRPRAVGIRGLGTQVTVDLRSPWPSTKSDAAARDTVHRWESMVLARSEGSGK